MIGKEGVEVAFCHFGSMGMPSGLVRSFESDGIE